jgi:hypothetical protein
MPATNRLSYGAALSERDSEWEVAESLPSRGEWPAVVGPLLFSKKYHFKTRKSLERTKIWSWFPTGPDTKNDCAGKDQQQFIGLGCELVRQLKAN